MPCRPCRPCRETPINRRLWQRRGVSLHSRGEELLTAPQFMQNCHRRTGGASTRPMDAYGARNKSTSEGPVPAFFRMNKCGEESALEHQSWAIVEKPPTSSSMESSLFSPRPSPLTVLLLSSISIRNAAASFSLALSPQCLSCRQASMAPKLVSYEDPTKTPLSVQLCHFPSMLPLSRVSSAPS